VSRAAGAVTSRWHGLLRAGALLACLSPAHPPAEAGPASASTLWVDASARASDARGSAEAPFPRLRDALARAGAGTRILVAAGEYRETVTIPDGVSVVGAGPGRTVLRGRRFSRAPVVTLRGRSSLEALRVTGGEEGVHVDVNADIRLARVEILDNRRNGIGFERVEAVGGEPARVEIEDCLVSGNSDGIDLESTRGVIRGCRLVGNRDDGVDYDGDTDCALVGSEIRDNGDDGVEIRLKRETRARLEGNRISGNGEDGIEIIESVRPGPTANRVEMSGNAIHANVRYGIGVVARASEDVREGLRIPGLVLGENRISGNGRADLAGTNGPRASDRRASHPGRAGAPAP